MPTLAETLAQLPDDYEVTVRSKYGTVEYTDRAGDLLSDDGTIIRLEDFKLVTDIHWPEQNGWPLPPDLRPYKNGDIGGHINPPDEKVIRGPIGEWLALIEPQTEASLSSLGAGIIAGIGAYMGRGIKLKVGRITHTPNIFAIQVGPTGTARKGTADGEIRDFLYEIDSSFAINNIVSGFGSGEALIERVADNPPPKDDEEEAYEPNDQRLYIQEGEFSKLLRIADRMGSVLSDVIRLAFDANRPLANAAKTSKKLVSSRHCISMFGGITPDELIQIFPKLAAVSGTGNRYLWVWSDPDKLLPYGGEEVDTHHIARTIASNLRDRRKHMTLEFSAGARAWWETHYPTLRQASHVPENIQPMVTRISDQTQRIALVYAATEGSETITREHLETGYAWVEHSIETVQAVLGGLVRNEEAGRILAALRQHPGVPAQKSELHDLFSRHITGTALDAAIKELEDAGLAYQWEGRSRGGRPPIVVMATTPKRKAENTFFARNAKKGPDDPLQTSFAQTEVKTTESPGQRVPKVSEKSSFEGLPRESITPNAREVSPDDLPDPF